MIAFRTCAGPNFGIGHLSRCHRLAFELMHFGYICHFYVDVKNKFISEFLYPFDCTGLYDSENESIVEEYDSFIFKKKLMGKLDAIVVDDYRLSKTWESSVALLKVPIMVLDDRNNDEHFCSILVDGKWEGELTQSRYKNKVNNDCIRLLGPKYTFLDLPDYDYQDKKISLKDEFKIIISFGGGGDMKIFIQLIKSLLRNSPKNAQYSLHPVVGPYAKNQDYVINLAENYKNVFPILNAKNLGAHLKNSHLYIGAAGGTLYEALLLGIPSISFSLSGNQENTRSYLEDFGHYFHLGKLFDQSYEKIAKLTWLIIQNYNRVVQISKKNNQILLDCNGANRAAYVLKNLIDKKVPVKSEDFFTTTDLSNDTDNNNYSKYEFVLVDDSHINSYLEARNLHINLQHMTETKKINWIDHCLWWFNSQRISYILKKGDKPLVYIWHQTKSIQGVMVLIGGWFVCSSKVGAMEAMYALNQQLQITDQEFAGIPWVAVIKKTNNFVQILSKRMGFYEISEDSFMHKIAQECFPNATQNDFHYYCRNSIEKL